MIFKQNKVVLISLPTALIKNFDTFRFAFQIAFLAIVLFQNTVVVYAKNTNEDKYYINNNRPWIAEIPLWVPGFRGQLSYGDYDLSTTGSDKEREFKRLNNTAGLAFYFVGRIAAHYNKIWFQVDAFSGAVTAAFSYNSQVGNKEIEFVNIKIQGVFPRAVFGYKVWEYSNENSFRVKLIPHIGVKYHSFLLKSDIFDSNNIVDVRPSWLEPLIGLYIPIDYKRFKIEIQADYGQSGSNFSWVLNNRYRYRVSNLIDLQLGWNFFKIHHIENIGSSELKSNIRLFGPTAGIGFRF